MRPFGNIVRGVNEGCPLSDSTLPKTSSLKMNMDGWKTILSFLGFDLFCGSGLLVFEGGKWTKDQHQLFTAKCFQRSGKSLAHSCTSWFYGIYVDIPLFTGLYTCQAVSRIFSINRTTSTDGELVVWMQRGCFKSKEHIFPHGKQTQAFHKDSSQTNPLGMTL